MNNELTYDEIPDKEQPSVLIVDDVELDRDRLVEVCSKTSGGQKLKILTASSISAAMNVVMSEPVHVLLLDKNIGPDDTSKKDNGIESIPDFLNIQPQLQILIVTASKSTSDAVNAIRYGALNYITKESPDNLLLAQINKAVSIARLTLSKIRNKRRSDIEKPVILAGHSKIMKKTLSRIQAVSESNRPVFLIGENGTGKSTAAHMIHSLRSQFLKQEDRPFFAINCGALAPVLIERELFGNEVGAYTDAKEEKPGFFELANNGTLFLDEVAELTPDLQVKLLQVLQDGKFYRLGSTKPRVSKFKLICATNRDIDTMVNEGTFREDLFMRISTFIVKIPSLAERREDIPDIIRSILPRLCEENQVVVTFEELPTDFIDYLCKTHIKGNVRGLEHQISRLLIYSPKDIKGRPILNQWTSIDEMEANLISSDGRPALRWEDLSSLPFDIIGPNFPGFVKAIELFTDKLILNAKSKFKKNVDIARILKLSESAVSVRLKQIERKTSHFTEANIQTAKPAREIVS